MRREMFPEIRTEVLLSVDYLFAEGEDREAGHFEVLSAERYSDDGDAEQSPEKDVAQAGPEAAENAPDYVHRRPDAS